MKEVPTTSNYATRNLPKRTIKLCESHVIEEEAKVVSVAFSPKTYKTIEIVHLTDFQYGSKAFKEGRYLEYQEWLLSVPNRFVILGGDIIDAATVMSISSPYENLFDPSKQALRARDLLMPLRPRILGYVGGNHERRTIKGFGDSGHLLASLLAIPYSCGEQSYDISFGVHQPFKITAWHGVGCARTKGAKMQMLHRFMKNGDSQLYLVGHLHDVMVTYDWRRYRSSNEKGETVIKFQKVAGAMSSSFQDFWNTYAEIAGLAPSDTLMARCILDPDGGWEITLR